MNLEKLDPVYFGSGSWAERRGRWEELLNASSFWRANAEDFRRRIATKPGARAVINLGGYALLRLLRGDRYQNVYQRAIGGTGPAVDEQRVVVDKEFGLDGQYGDKQVRAVEFFFAAV